MAGEYSLLDQETLNRLSMQNAQPQGTPTLTEVPSPSTAIPAISPELMAFGEKIGTPAPELTGMQKFGKVTEALGPLLSQFGTTLMRGRNAITGAPTETVGSQMGQIISNALVSQKLNEATKKMIAAQLAGKGGVGGGAGFNEGQPGGFTGGEVAGLTPEQISGLYGAGLGLREKELKRPFDELNVISDAYHKVMVGEGTLAANEAHLATAQKARYDLARAMAIGPYKDLQDWQTKEKALEEADVRIEEIKAKTETEKGKPATAVEERKKTVAETKLKTAEEKKVMAGLDVDQIQAIEAAKTAGGAVKISDAGDRLIVTDPKTGREKFSFPIGTKPEAGAGTKARKAEIDLSKAAMVRVAPLAVKYLEGELAALPGGKQKVDLANLISSLRGYTGEIDPGVLLAKASPELQEKFNNLIDIYTKTSGISETRFGTIVHTVFGAGGAAPTPAEKPTTGKSVTEKYKPGAAAPPSEGLSTSQISQIEDQARRDKKPNAVYESQGWRVEVRGGKVVNITPKKYGTF